MMLSNIFFTTILSVLLSTERLASISFPSVMNSNSLRIVVLGSSTARGSGTPPQPDDIFDVVFSKPFGSNDIYEFSSIEAAGINQSKARQDLDLVAAVPNPLIVTVI